MKPRDDRHSARTTALFCLIAVQVIGLGSLVFWAIGAAFTLVSIGAGEIPLWVIAVWCYPLWFIGVSGTAWGLFAKERFTGAAVASVLSILPFLAIFLVF